MAQQLPGRRFSPGLSPDQEDVIQGFENDWQNGKVPQLEDYLPKKHQPNMKLLKELIKVDLECRWRPTSSRTPIPGYFLEHYLQLHPALLQDGKVPLDMIAEEYRIRRRWGYGPTHQEYMKRFCHHGDYLVAGLKRIDTEPTADCSVRQQAVPNNENNISQQSTILPEADPHVDQWETREVTHNNQGVSGAAGGGGVEQPTISHAFGTPTSSGHRFRILRPHAKGGIGQVFVARDEELNREVALKEILEYHADKPDSRTRFLLEAQVTGGLEHPGIVPVYGLGSNAAGRPFYAMRFIRGESLKEAINQYHQVDISGRDPGNRTLELRKLLGRFINVCNAIAYAHSRGVLHRDLKPSNIMLGKYGETLVVDWGLAKTVGRPEKPVLDETTLRPVSSSSAETQVGSALGTPQYMSPEQAAGRLDLLGPASDIYSLGATLYCILTGQAPIQDPELGLVLCRVQEGDFPRPSHIKQNVPPALEAICLKAMALKPADRYSSAHALGEDIEHWLADEPVKVYREPWSFKAARWGRRHRSLVTGAAVLLLTTVVALIIGTVFLEQAREGEMNQKKQAELAKADALQKADAEKKANEQLLQQKTIAEEKRREAERQQKRAEGALAALSKIKVGNVLDLQQLLDRYRNPETDRDAKLALLFAISEFQGPLLAALPDLRKALADSDALTRATACLALSKMGGLAKSAVPDLIKILGDFDSKVRGSGVIALGHIGQNAQAGVPAIVRMLINAQEQTENRVEAAMALQGIGDVPAARLAVPGLLKVLENPTNPAVVRVRIIWALRVHNLKLLSLPGVMPAFTKIISEPSLDDQQHKMLRYDAAYMLGMLEGPKAPSKTLDVLLEFLKDHTILIFTGSEVKVNWTGKEKTLVFEKGKGDGRIMAVHALKQMGISRVTERPQIIQELRKIARESKDDSLRKETQMLLLNWKK